MGRIVRWFALASILLIGCDRGIEANQDNLSHFATVASELNRDARELELLSKKVGQVRSKLEMRKTDVAEHVYNDEIRKQRDLLLERLKPVDPAPTADTIPMVPLRPNDEALAGAVALHDQLFAPLRIVETTLRDDNDYGWWLEELGLQSADERLFSEDPQAGPSSSRDKALENCRSGYSRPEACLHLLNDHLTSTHFAGVKKQRLAELASEIERLGLIQQQFTDEAANRKVSADKVMAAYGSSFDGLIIWGFPALIIAVLVIVMFEGRRRKTADIPLPDTLAVVTVLLLVSAIIILGLGGKIQPEALGTLIGGISGYVLGKGSQVMGGDKKEEKDDKPPVPTEAKPLPEPESKPEPIKAEPTKPSLAAAELDEPSPATAKG